MKINSKEYWDERFKSNDWILAGGDDQNRYFYSLMLELIPEYVKDEISNELMSICDFGCAEGDGTQIFKKIFQYSDVTGVDISEHALNNARKKYLDINFTTKIDKQYNLIISSNTLEHFSEPYKVLEKLFDYSDKYVILLLPFREYCRIDEHLYTFDFNNIPLNYNDFKLLYINWIDSNKMYWNGQQIILIYMKNANNEQINRNFLDMLSLKANYIENLQKEIINKDLLTEKKQKELMKISDWATMLNERQMQLTERLNRIENNFILKIILKLFIGKQI